MREIWLKSEAELDLKYPFPPSEPVATVENEVPPKAVLRSQANKTRPDLG